MGGKIKSQIHLAHTIHGYFEGTPKKIPTLFIRREYNLISQEQ